MQQAVRTIKARVGLNVCSLILLSATLAGVAFAQESSQTSESDHETIKTLLQRVAQLEAEIQELKATQGKPAPSAESEGVPSPAVTTPPANENEKIDVHQAMEQPALKFHGLQFRGFADVGWHASDLKGATNSFALGQLDLFMTSQLSQKLNVLGELVFESDESNAFGVDLERFLLQYAASDYFKLGIGRYHTAIGYYNTAYHHGTWLQTAVGRPFIFLFEDGGGILPIHNVGLTATGAIPSGGLGLHYVVEVGNGRTSHSSSAEAVQNVVDENNGKAVNLALYARPALLPGLQTGFSVYRDNLTPIGLPNISETISDGYVVYTKAPWELLNEGILIRHAINGSGLSFNSPAFYTQISRQFGVLRPYFRYQYLNISGREPIFGNVSRQNGPSLGLRYDFAESAAFKVQYDRTARRNLPPFNELQLQVAFTF